MARSHLFAAAAALCLVSLLSSSARAEVPVLEPPAAGPPSPTTPKQAVGSQEEGPMLPGGIMRVLSGLERIGVVEIDRTSTLVSSTGVSDTTRLPVREATWAAPEPPKMPLFFGRVCRLKF